MLASTDPIITTHILSTMLMAGIAWFVQIVHYPLFSKVGNEYFPEYLKGHSILTTFIVSPLMLIEVCTGGFLFHKYPQEKIFFIGFVLLIVIWFSTFLIQVPRQNILGKGFKQKAYEELIFSNCIRTALWTMRMIIFVFFF